MTAISQTRNIKQNSINVLNIHNLCEDVHLLFMDLKYFMHKYKNKRAQRALERSPETEDF